MRVSALHTYPIKAFKGLNHESIQCGEMGLDGDRQMMVVDPDGKFMSQRKYPIMSGCAVQYKDSGAMQLSYQGADREQCHTLPAPDEGVQEVTVWKDRLNAQVWGGGTSDFLRDLINVSFSPRLVRFSGESRRRVKFKSGDSPVGFADAYPFLVANTGSLEVLNELMLKEGLNPVQMDRFRPNIVIDGLNPFDEFKIDHLQIGPDVVLKFVKPCTRCTVVTVNQQTHKADCSELLKVLQKLPASEKGGVFFGQNAVLLKGDGAMIKVGSEVCINSWLKD